MPNPVKAFLNRRVVPVANLNRARKARMIESVLLDFLQAPIVDLKILDVGCGNGDICSYLARANRVEGIDIKDQRRDRNGTFNFQVVESPRLPFEAGQFDIVLSNHVVEHVPDQNAHMSEIRRVLKPTGIVYLATPNAGSPFMKGHVGNDQVLNLDQMYRLFGEHSFQATEYTTRMLKEPAVFHMPTKAGRWIPEGMIRALRPIIPSHVFILTP